MGDSVISYVFSSLFLAVFRACLGERLVVRGWECHRPSYPKDRFEIDKVEDIRKLGEYLVKWWG